LHNLLADLAEDRESLCYGASSVVRPASTFSLKRLLINHFNQTWQETCFGDGDSDFE